MWTSLVVSKDKGNILLIIKNSFITFIRISKSSKVGAQTIDDRKYLNHDDNLNIFVQVRFLVDLAIVELCELEVLIKVMKEKIKISY